jgi:hypothetical protein
MGSLFKSPKIPEPPPPVPMADPNDREIEIAQRRELSKKRDTTGRGETLLSDASGPYTKSTLGTA